MDVVSVGDGGEWKEEVRCCGLEWWEERWLTMAVMVTGLVSAVGEERESE